MTISSTSATSATFISTASGATKNGAPAPKITATGKRIAIDAGSWTPSHFQGQLHQTRRNATRGTSSCARNSINEGGVFPIGTSERLNGEAPDLDLAEAP